MTVSQFIVNLTIIVLFIILWLSMIDFFKSHKRCLETYINGVKIIALSGWLIQIMSYKLVHSSFPVLIFLCVWLFQMLRHRGINNEFTSRNKEQ